MNRRLQNMGAYLGVAKPPEPVYAPPQSTLRQAAAYVVAFLVGAVVYGGFTLLFGSNLRTAVVRGIAFSFFILVVTEVMRRRRAR